MGERLTVRFDEDNTDNLLAEHDETGKDKGRIVNERLRQAYNGNKPTLADSIIPTFGQSLFVAGFVVALLATWVGGVGIALLGLGLMVGAKVDEYSAKHDVPVTTALIKVLGA